MWNICSGAFEFNLLYEEAMMKIQIPEKVNKIIGTLTCAGYEAYAVGGCVRDAVLGREPADWDITTSASPQEVKRLFPRTIDTGIRHGTVTVMLGREGFEVTTYRIDGIYEDGRHPTEVRFTQSLLEDLKRRDFTINAMAYNDEAGLVDEFDGVGDLRRGLIRCVGDARERFTEDALRMMRAVRFAAQLGFSLEPETREAVRQMAGNLEKVSAERVQAELMKLLLSPHPEMLRDAWETGLTAVFLPEFNRCMECRQNTPHHMYGVGEHTLRVIQGVRPDRVLRLAALLHDFGKPHMRTTDSQGVDHFQGHAAYSEELAGRILRRLKFDNDTIRQVRRLVYWHDCRPSAEAASVRRAVSRIGGDLFPMYLELRRADILAQSRIFLEEKLENLDQVEAVYHQILEEQNCLTLKDLAVSGRELMDAGFAAGPLLGETLNHLLDQVIEDPGRNERGWLLEEALRWKEEVGR